MNLGFRLVLILLISVYPPLSKGNPHELATSSQNESAENMWEKCETKALGTNPYSSSYLPHYKGDIVRSVGREEALPNLSLTPAERESYLNKSLMQRFDSLVESVTGKHRKLQFKALQEMFDPNAPKHAGFCHQWAAAALDPTVNRILENAGDLKCHGVVVTNAELKELVTAFYYPPEAKFNDEFRSDPLGENDKAFLNFSGGADWMAAHRFDQFATNQMNAGEGYVLNIAHHSEPWNQPVFRSQRCVKRAPISDLKAAHVPVNWLASAYPALSRWLGTVAASDAAVAIQAGKYKSNNAAFYTDQSLKLKADVKSLSQNLDPVKDRDLYSLVQATSTKLRGLYAYADVREAVFELNRALADKNFTRINLDLEFTRVRLQQTYGVSTEFARDGRLFETRDYDFILAKDSKGKSAGSSWITLEKSRPGQAWAPIKKSVVDKAHGMNHREEMKLLLKIIAGCKSSPQFASRED